MPSCSSVGEGLLFPEVELACLNSVEGSSMHARRLPTNGDRPRTKNCREGRRRVSVLDSRNECGICVNRDWDGLLNPESLMEKVDME